VGNIIGSGMTLRIAERSTTGAWSLSLPKSGPMDAMTCVPGAAAASIMASASA
jgi:hypothetical protein